MCSRNVWAIQPVGREFIVPCIIFKIRVRPAIGRLLYFCLEVGVKKPVKRLTARQRIRDVRRALSHRSQRKPVVALSSKRTRTRTRKRDGKKIFRRAAEWILTNEWINRNAQAGLNVRFQRKGNGVVLLLPEVMNFSSHYKQTMLYMMAIRKLARAPKFNKKAYQLAAVEFEGLKRISSSAALVLTAELSKWDDALHSKLKKIGEWDPEIQKRFIELGFFDLFENNPFKEKKPETNSRIRHVRYIKGSCGDPQQHRTLRKSLKDIVGEEIQKYTFLKSGLDEAITNVVQHAYPNVLENALSEQCDHKKWYLTGGYDTETKGLKIAFYDQGVGIPKTLPSSKFGEAMLEHFSFIDLVERKKDEVLLKAAMEYRRTSTLETDRGKGLSDLLQFVKQRGGGYLSILSRHGLYKFSIEDGEEIEKSERLPLPMQGTLIIWKINLG